MSLMTLLRSVLHSIGRAVSSDPEVRRLLDEHPRLIRFVRNRLRPDYRFGLWLTFGLSIALVFLYFFANILEDLANNDPLIRADLRVSALIQMFRTPELTKAMVFFTDLGRWQTLLAGAVALGLVLVLWRRTADILALALGLGLGEVLLWMVKNLIQRSRPEPANALALEGSFSFPSGHSFAAVVFYGLVTYFLMRAVRGIWRVAVPGVGIALIVAIGFSRVYLGVHWPSDVLGSWAGGAAWVAVAVTALHARDYGRPKPLPYFPAAARVTVAALTSVAWAFLTVRLYVSVPIQQPHAIAVPRPNIPEGQIASQLFRGLPNHSEDITGRPTEPINIVLVGAEESMRGGFLRAGWRETNRLNLRTLRLEIKALLAKTPHPEQPEIPSFWNGRPDQLAFQKSTPTHLVRERHDIRIWNSGERSSAGMQIWVATAHSAREMQETSSLPFVSKIDPFVDRERQHVRESLEAAGIIRSAQSMTATQPTLGKNFAGDPFTTDGKALLLFLK